MKMMAGVSIPQPWASALLAGIVPAIAWPVDWPMMPALVGRWVAIHSTIAWSEAQARAAAQLGVVSAPRGEVLGVARLTGWARRGEGAPWLGAEPGPEAEAIEAGWPLTETRCAAFFDGVVLLNDGPPLVSTGNATKPWKVPDSIADALRARWGRQERPAERARVQPSGGGAPERRRQPPTADARRTVEQLADLLPEGWSTRADGFTVSIVDPTGRCRRALTRPHERPQLADVLAELVMGLSGGQLDAHILRIRTACPRAIEGAR